MLDDDEKLKQKFFNKRVNAEKEGIAFSLTFEEFEQLMLQAGITSSQLGIKQYHLASYNDLGTYSIGNCRFIWYLANLAEKRVSNRSRIASSQNLILATKALTAEVLARRQSGLAAFRLKKKDQIEERRRLAAQKTPSFSGSKNSQFATIWITNERQNRKIRIGESIPPNWRRGRIGKAVSFS